MTYSKTIKRNETFPSLDIKHERGEPLVAWDLRGYTLRLTYYHYNRKTIVKEQIIGDGLTLVGVGFNIVRTASFNVDWKVGDYVVELWLTNPSNTYTKNFFSGTVKVLGSA